MYLVDDSDNGFAVNQPTGEPEQPAGRLTPRNRKLLVFLLKSGIAAATVWWMIHSGILDTERFSSLDLGGALVGLLVAQLVMFTLPMVRWFILVRTLGLTFSKRDGFVVAIRAYFVGIFVPAGLGLDGYRVYAVSKRNTGHGWDAFATVVMDRILGLLGLVIVGAAFGVVCLVGEDGRELAPIVLVMVALAVGLSVGFILLASERIGGWIERVLPYSQVKTVRQALQRYGQEKKRLAFLLALSICAHLATVTSAYFAFGTLRTDVAFITVAAAMPMVILSYLIPLTPLGVGVSDSFSEGVFGALNVADGAEMTMVVRAMTLALAALGVLGFLFSDGKAVSGMNEPAPKGPDD